MHAELSEELQLEIGQMEENDFDSRGHQWRLENWV